LAYYTWVVEGKLAISPLPRLSDIPKLSKIFRAVAVLVMPHEVMGYIDYYLNTWRVHGVEVYYAPTPDFHPIDLLELYRLNSWIEQVIEKGGSVLVHCRGGIGRSGLAAASFLVHSGWDPASALMRIKSLKPSALECSGQLRMFQDYVNLLSVVDKEVLSRLVNAAYRLGETLFKHSSKSAQLALELMEALDMLNARAASTIYASILHCTGLEVAASLPLDEETRRILSRYGEGAGEAEALIIRAAHTLDKYMDSKIVYTDYERGGGRVEIKAYYSVWPHNMLEEARAYLKTLGEILGQEVVLTEEEYSP